MRRIFYAFAGGLTMMAVTTPVQAAPKVEADPSVEYVVTPQAGVWMVLAGSYKGPYAHELAHQLVYLLRSHDHLPAYIFDFSEGKRREQQEYLDALNQRSPDLPKRKIRIEDEFGVLVGGYKSAEEASEAMNKIKKLPMPEFKLADPSILPTIGKPLPSEKDPKKIELRMVPVNPLERSFVTRNPTVPVEKPDPNKPDPLLKDLNKDEEYNLLKCKHPWTLVIKQYEGVSVIPESSTSDSILKFFGVGDKKGEVLNAAAMNAHNLAEALRTKKLEAYVLHTRRSSLVTVGAYDTPDDPQLLQMQALLTATYNRKPGMGIKQYEKTDKPIDLSQLQISQLQLFAQPLPMKVPQLDK
jgi:hypothetical protein